jgi:hypothetical protein
MRVMSTQVAPLQTAFLDRPVENGPSRGEVEVFLRLVQLGRTTVEQAEKDLGLTARDRELLLAFAAETNVVDARKVLLAIVYRFPPLH